MSGVPGWVLALGGMAGSLGLGTMAKEGFGWLTHGSERRDKSVESTAHSRETDAQTQLTLAQTADLRVVTDAKKFDILERATERLDEERQARARVEDTLNQTRGDLRALTEKVNQLQIDLRLSQNDREKLLDSLNEERAHSAALALKLETAEARITVLEGQVVDLTAKNVLLSAGRRA